ncbi:MAG: hypothetical protein JWO94_2220, partial [Verrucomicrobiaceae bacterium]|nr:hypothetical protein [Verrucomicrobiaceae bacterium]
MTAALPTCRPCFASFGLPASLPRLKENSSYLPAAFPFVMSFSPPASEPTAPAAAGGRGLGRLLISFLLCLGVPVMLLRSFRPKHDPTEIKVLHSDVAQDVRDVPKTIAELKAANPDYIGIGNSMLFTRLGTTPAKMNELTGKKFFFILKNGSGSAAWYLTLKNIVAASETHPKLVFFFIRDNDLTSPFFRTAGKYATYIRSLRGPQEPVVDALLKVPPARPGPIGEVSRRLNGPGGFFDFPAWDEKIPRQLIDVAMDVGSGLTPKAELRSLLSARFAVRHLRGDMAADLPAAGSVDGYAPDSYNDLNGNYP